MSIVPVKYLSILGLKHCKNISQYGDPLQYNYIYIQKIYAVFKQVRVSGEHENKVIGVKLKIEGYPVVKTS